MCLAGRALRVINRSLGSELPLESPLRAVPKIISNCPELMATSPITNLLTDSDALAYAHELLGVLSLTVELCVSPCLLFL